MITIQDAVVTTGIEEVEEDATIAILNVVKTVVIIIVVVNVQAVVMKQLLKINHNSHVTIVGKSPNVALMNNAMAEAAVVTLQEAVNANMVVAGMKNVVVTSIIPSWDRETRDLNKSCSVSVIPASILTNTRIYPWKRRDKMFPQISHPSKMFS